MEKEPAKFFTTADGKPVVVRFLGKGEKHIIPHFLGGPGNRSCVAKIPATPDTVSVLNSGARRCLENCLARFFSEEAVKAISETVPDTDLFQEVEPHAAQISKTFSEYENEAELLAAVEHDSALFNDDTGEYTPPTLDYVTGHYGFVKQLSNGGYLVAYPKDT